MNKAKCFYVNSYPRSGNTWVRGLFNRLLSPVNIDVNPYFEMYFNLIEIKRQHKLTLKEIRSNEITMIKSHGRYEENYKSIPIIYLVRDGRDAIISYYHFNVDHRGYAESFDSYFDRHVVQDKMVNYRERVLRKFMGDWSQNVLSYINKNNVLIVRYEDLIHEPILYCEAMFNHIGVNVTKSKLVDAIEESRRQLIEKNIRHDRQRGRTGNWRSVLTEQQNSQFLQKHKFAIDLMGYSYI